MQTATKSVLELKSRTTFLKYLRQTIFANYNLIDMLVAPAAERNKEPILEILKQILPSKPLELLEIASGTGQHTAHFASSLTNVQFQPTEVDLNSLKSIEHFIKSYNLTNVRDPLHLDITKPLTEWPESLSTPQSRDVIYCANMIHITPWLCTQSLFSSAGVLLKPKGLLITYGPYATDGVLSPESNVRFDMSLRSQHPEWGVRDIRDLVQLGLQNGLQLIKKFEMPANNKILVFEKS